MSSSSNKSRGVSTPLFILVALIALAGAGYSGFSWWSAQNTDNSDSAEEVRRNMPQPIFMQLEPFTINLLNDGSDIDRVLYISIELRLANEKTRKRMHEYLPEVRSRLLLLLSEQNSTQIMNNSGKLKLMADIKKTLTPTLVAGEPDQDISDVLFTTFILR